MLSDEHAQAIVWRKDEDSIDDEDPDDDDTDRLFAFEVSKTNEQEEGVTSKDGFEVSMSSSHLITLKIMRSMYRYEPHVWSVTTHRATISAQMHCDHGSPEVTSSKEYSQLASWLGNNDTQRNGKLYLK